MKYLLILSCIGLIANTGCSKDDSASGETKTELITKSSWKYENAGGDIDKNGTIDMPPPASLLQPCITDNFLVLNADGTGTIDEGATKCDPTLQQTTSASWSFSNNETVLNLSGNGLWGISGQFKIVTLNSTQLHLSKDTTISGIPLALLIQLKH
jgi:hypothetical protein